MYISSTTGRRPDHRGPHGRPADARLGDRRVEHPRAAERLEQALGQLERPAVVGDVLAVVDHARVAQHLLRRAPRGARPGSVMAPDARASPSGGGANRSDDGRTRGRRRRSCPCTGTAGPRTGRGRARRPPAAPPARCAPAPASRRAATVASSAAPASSSWRFEPLDRVDRPPGRLLVARPVLVPRIGQGVAVVAIRARLDEHGPLARAASAPSPAEARRARRARPCR